MERLEGHLGSLLDAILDRDALVIPRGPRCQNCMCHNDKRRCGQEVVPSRLSRAPRVRRSEHKPKKRKTMNTKMWRSERRKHLHHEPQDKKARDVKGTLEESI